MSQIEEEFKISRSQIDDKPITSGRAYDFIFTFGYLVLVLFCTYLIVRVLHLVTFSKFNSKTVQHLEGGIVKRILVQEGMKVEAGDILIEMDSTQQRLKRTIK